MERIIKGITEAHEAAYVFEYEKGYSTIINDQIVSKLIEETVLEVMGEAALHIRKIEMRGEDFSFYQQVVPGCVFIYRHAL